MWPGRLPFQSVKILSSAIRIEPDGQASTQYFGILDVAAWPTHSQLVKASGTDPEQQ
jgi:hypothetical protein